MSQRLPRALSALFCLLSSGCFRSGYELLEQAPLAPDDTPLGASQGGSSGFDAGVLLSDPFGTPTVLLDVNSNELDQSPFLSSDGLELWLGSHRDNTGFEDLFVARRARTADDFEQAVAVSELNSGGRDTGPALSNDGTRMYYASERNGGQGRFDLWLARRASLGQDFVDAEELRELNSRDDEFDATLSYDEREIIFVSDRSGSLRLWRSLLECP